METAIPPPRYVQTEIATQLNNMPAATSGCSGSPAAATVLSGKSLTEACYHPACRDATRTMVAGDRHYPVIVPEAGFLCSYPETSFDALMHPVHTHRRVP